MDLTTKGSTLIKILTAIDAEKIKNKYPRPSHSREYPTGIEPNDISMSCTGSRGDVVGQGGPDLQFDAYPNDVVSFSAETTPNNSGYAVSIYNIRNNYSRDRILNVTGTKENLIELTVQGNGRTNLLLLFSLHTKDDSEKTKDLIGYFYFDSNITIR
jgi:hypothetical protein